MSLQGTIDTLSVDDLFGWMVRRKLSGILALKRDRVTKKFQKAAKREADGA